MPPRSPVLKRIYLTGYMGAGKSTIGRLLASKMGYRFIDTDRQLVKDHQKTVSQIFADHGEAFFRESELTLLTELSQQCMIVISTGGGTLTREETYTLANQPGSLIVYLRAPVEVLFERVIFSPKDRPMIDVPNAEEVFKERFRSRELFYNRSDLVIDTLEKPPDIVSDEVHKALLALEPFMPPAHDLQGADEGC